MIFSLEGNIGSGKSTILQQLKDRLGDNQCIKFLQEPVAEWENIKDAEGTTILEKFYGNQEKYAFSFQMMAYISRLALLKKTIRENPDCHIVTERSINTDKNVFAKMLHEDDKIEEVNYQIYQKWFDEFIEETMIDGIIYIKATGQTCFDRVKKRSRNGESNIPLEYLERCGKEHDNWIIDKYHGPKLVIDVNTNTDEHPNQTTAWLDSIVDFMFNEIEDSSDLIVDEEVKKVTDNLIANTVNQVFN